MATGAITTLKDAQRSLAAEWGIVYPSLNGVWRQLRKHRIKKKTGRRHRRADPDAQAAFIAGFRCDPGPPPGPPSGAADGRRQPGGHGRAPATGPGLGHG